MIVYTHKTIYRVWVYCLEEDLPKIRSIWIDENQKEWTVTDVRQQPGLWTNPPSPLPAWELTLEGYPANTLRNAEGLTPKTK